MSARMVSFAKYTCFETTIAASVGSFDGKSNETTAPMHASDGRQFDFIPLQHSGVLQSLYIAVDFAICAMPADAVPIGKKIKPMAMQKCKTVLMANVRNILRT